MAQATGVINYPQLPPELQKLADNTISVPDYSDEENVPPEFRTLGLIENDESNETIEDNDASSFNDIDTTQKYEDLSWNANKRDEFLMDSQFVRDATNRRAALGFAKGLFMGGSIGALMSYFFIKRSKSKLPPSLHGYTIGGTGIVFATVKMVQDTRRYQEYIAYMQSGIANPDQLHIEDAKEHLGKVMTQTYHPEAIRQFKESPHTQRWLEQQLSNK